MDILDVLSKFKAASMTDKQIKKLKESYLSDENFVPEKVASVSAAAKSLCVWVSAVEALFRV
jgi:hypothetical protein